MECFLFSHNRIIGTLTASSPFSVNNPTSNRIQYHYPEVPLHLNLMDLPGNQEIIVGFTSHGGANTNFKKRKKKRTMASD